MRTFLRELESLLRLSEMLELGKFCHGARDFERISICHDIESSRCSDSKSIRRTCRLSASHPSRSRRNRVGDGADRKSLPFLVHKAGTSSPLPIGLVLLIPAPRGGRFDWVALTTVRVAHKGVN